MGTWVVYVFSFTQYCCEYLCTDLSEQIFPGLCAMYQHRLALSHRSSSLNWLGAGSCAPSQPFTFSDFLWLPWHLMVSILGVLAILVSLKSHVVLIWIFLVTNTVHFLCVLFLEKCPFPWLSPIQTWIIHLVVDYYYVSFRNILLYLQEFCTTYFDHIHTSIPDFSQVHPLLYLPNFVSFFFLNPSRPTSAAQMCWESGLQLDHSQLIKCYT